MSWNFEVDLRTLTSKLRSWHSKFLSNFEQTSNPCFLQFPNVYTEHITHGTYLVQKTFNHWPHTDTIGSRNCTLDCCFTCNLVALAMKRPAAAGCPVMKKPAAANAVKALKHEVEKYKHEEETSSEQDTNARDKMKAEKWARMKTAGALPAYLINLYEEEAKHSPLGKRRFQTEVINKLFKKNETGQWELDASDVQFQSHKALYEKRYNRDETEALPKSLLLGMYFQHDETSSWGKKTGYVFLPTEGSPLGQTKGLTTPWQLVAANGGQRNSLRRLALCLGSWSGPSRDPPLTLRLWRMESYLLPSTPWWPKLAPPATSSWRTHWSWKRICLMRRSQSWRMGTRPCRSTWGPWTTWRLSVSSPMEAASQPQPLRTAWETSLSRLISSTPKSKSSRATWKRKSRSPLELFQSAVCLWKESFEIW